MRIKPEYLKIMIIDHDPDSGLRTQQLLHESGNNDIRYLSDSGLAKVIIQTSIPDVIFLNIPEKTGSGIDFLKYIESEMIHTHVVVISDLEEAIKEVVHYSITAYIEKPVTKDKILQSLEKIRLHKILHHSIEKNIKDSQFCHLIEINSNKEIRFYQPNRIVMVEADGSYSHLYMEDGRKETVTQNLGKLEEKLPVSQFIRISRKSIVNAEYIRRLNKLSGEMELECRGVIMKAVASMKYLNNVHWIQV
ncbi:MAG: LytR/AlgR family response regulator transcription factor [Draconibacterium sp.]